LRRAGTFATVARMARSPRPWTVTRHDPIEKLEDNLWTVNGDVPGAPFHRRMSIVRRSDGTLLFFNAVPLEDAALAEVKAWGKPAFLVVPHDQHMIDARAFAEKLQLAVYGPKACETKIRERVEMAGTLDMLPPDPSMQIETVRGVKNGEPALIVHHGSGRVSLLVSDVIMNNAKSSIGFLPRMMGFAGGVKIVPVFRMMFLRDKPALKTQLEQWAGLTNLARLVPCHGDLVPTAAPEALRAAAATL
jgi:hypothetical protein